MPTALLLRMARLITGRPKVLVFNYCYHGTVDETFIVLDEEGTPIPRPNNMGPQIDPRYTTKVIEFNDVAALEISLSAGDVAAVLAEPVMTNIGIIHPEPGFHDELRRLTRKYGTYLIIDETHTICAGPGGYTAAHGLEAGFPDDWQTHRRRRAGCRLWLHPRSGRALPGQTGAR